MNAADICFSTNADNDRVYVYGDTTYQVEGRTGNYTVMMFAPDTTIVSPFLATMVDVKAYIAAAIERPEHLRCIAG